jgi:O-antigen/teichoic acid export membrane protein
MLNLGDFVSSSKLMVRNTSSLLIGELVGGITSVVILVVLANSLGAGQYAIVASALAITQVFQSLVDFGLQDWSIRRMSSDIPNAQDTMSKLVVNKSVLSVLAFFVNSVLVISLYGVELFPTFFVLYALSLVLDAFTQIMFSIFLSFETMHHRAISRITGLLSYFGLLLLLLDMGLGLIGAALAYLIGRATVFLFALLFGRSRLSGIVPIFDKDRIKSVFRAGAPFAAVSATTLLLYRIDIVLLTQLLPGQLEIAGWYSVSIQLMQVTTIVSYSIVGAAFPAIVRGYIQNGSNQGQSIVTRITKYLMGSGTFIFVSIFVLAQDIIRLLYVSAYSPAGEILSVHSWLALTATLRYTLSVTLIACNQPKRVASAASVRILIAIGLNINVLWVGYMFAAYALVILDSFEAIFYLYSVAKIRMIRVRPTLNALIKSSICGLATIIVLLTMKTYFLPSPSLVELAIIGVLGLSVFVVVAFATRLLDDVDKQLIKSILGQSTQTKEAMS